MIEGLLPLYPGQLDIPMDVKTSVDVRLDKIRGHISENEEKTNYKFNAILNFNLGHSLCSLILVYYALTIDSRLRYVRHHSQRANFISKSNFLLPVSFT